jgi:hypothetical protein
VRAAIGAVIVFAVVALGVIGAIQFGAMNRRPVAVAASYWVVDDRTIGVVIGNGGGIECTVASVSESASEVRAQSECDEPWITIGGSAVLKLTVTKLTLASPLGSRTVLDGLGHPAATCKSESACP